MAGPWEAFQPAATAPAPAVAAPAPAAAPAGGINPDDYPVPAAPAAPAAAAPAQDGPWSQFTPLSTPSAPGPLDGYPAAPAPPPTVPVQQPADPEQQLGDIGRSVVQGATLGFGDEAAAGLDAATHSILGFGNNSGTFDQRYAENLKAERARDAQIPASISGIGQLVGGVGTAMVGAPSLAVKGAGLLARAIPGVAEALDGAGYLANSARALPVVQKATNALAAIPGASALATGAGLAAEGAGYGGVQGFGDGQGSLQDRLASAASGAETGAVLGPAVAGGAKIIGKGLNAAGRVLSEAGFGPRRVLSDASGAPILDSKGQPIVPTSGVANVAGQNLVDAASNPESAINALSQPGNNQIVSGSNPSTFQVTRDAGLGQKELELRSAPDSSQDFKKLDGQQNAARVGAVEGAVPENASSADLVDNLQSQKTELQNQADAAKTKAQAGTLDGAAPSTPINLIDHADVENFGRITTTTQTANNSDLGGPVVTRTVNYPGSPPTVSLLTKDGQWVDAGQANPGDVAFPSVQAANEAAIANHHAAGSQLGPVTRDPASTQITPVIGGVSDATPTQTGAALRGAIDEARAPEIAAKDAAGQTAQDRAAAATAAVGGVPSGAAGSTGTALQGYGQGFRDTQVAADQSKADNVTRLNNLIDPDGKLRVDMTPISEKAAEILKTRPVNLGEMKGDHKDIFDDLVKLPPVQSYTELGALNTRVTSQMAEARPIPSRGVEYNNLKDIKGSIEAAMDKAAADPAVTADQLTPKIPDAAGPVAPGATDPGLAAPKASTKAYTPSGSSVDVRYGLREADELHTSHDLEGNLNPNYPQQYQPRQRTLTASKNQIQGIGNDLHGDEVGASASTATGAPIVGPDNIVESGNGRTLGIRQAYENNGAPADAYRAWLEHQGYDTSGYKNPVLVRERLTPMNEEQRVQWTKDAGADPILQRGSGELAVTDSKTITPELLHGYQGGDVASPENAQFVRDFISKIPENEQGKFSTTDNTLSTEGAQRIRNALTHYAYGDAGLTRALSETIDPQAKVLSGALQDAAGPMARLKSRIASGEVDPSVDISKHLVEATQVVQQARAKGISLANAVNQGSMFGDGVSPQAQAILKAAYGENLTGRMSQGKMTDLLSAYAKEAERQGTTGDMFGDKLSAEQILEGASAKYGKDAGQLEATTGNAVGPGPSDGVDGTQTRGPGDAAGGQGPSASGVSDASGSTSSANASDNVPGSNASGSGSGRADRSVLPTIEPKLEANITPEDAANIRAMRAAHKARKEITDKPGVAEVLKKGSRSGEFNIQDALVPGKIFQSGAGGGGRVQAAIAGGVKPADIADYAAFDMRKAAQNADGSIDPAKFETWRKKNSEALQALGQEDPAITSRFNNVQTATQHVADMQAKRAELDKTHPLDPGWGDSEVMPHIWVAGPKGADSIKNAMSGAKGSPVAADSIADYAAYNLRKEATVNGVIDPAKYATWAKRYDGALSVRPDIKAQFGSLADAQATLNDAAKKHTEALNDFQNSAAKQLLGGADPADTIGSYLNSSMRIPHMRDLARMTENDPAAREGVQRAIIDHVFKKLQGNSTDLDTGIQKLKSDQLQTWINNAAPALREVMTPHQVTTLQAVAADLQRSNLINSVTSGIGSDTTQKAALLAKGGAGSSVLNWMKSNGLTGAATLIGSKLGPFGALIGNRAGAAVAALKAAGVAQSADLLKEAMLNPGLARVLMTNVTQKNGANVASAFISQLNRAVASRSAHVAAGVVNANQPDNEPQNAMTANGR